MFLRPGSRLRFEFPVPCSIFSILLLIKRKFYCMPQKVLSYTRLHLTDRLPLTCAREGTCCHGKAVWINPWELAFLAKTKGMPVRYFRDRFCEFGGIRLLFDGPAGWKGLAACCMYQPGAGCTVHAGRPLVCRLYPLGRERHGESTAYLFRGEQFPCSEGCPGVVDLPDLTVAEYLDGQQVDRGEAAQDAYLDLVQELADGAFALLLDTGLAATGDRLTLRSWRRLGEMTPQELTGHIGPEWIDRLMLSGEDGVDDPVAYVKRHHDQLQEYAQEAFGSLPDAAALSGGSGLMMAMALHLGRSLGAEPSDLAATWIKTARKHGAKE